MTWNICAFDSALGNGKNAFAIVTGRHQTYFRPICRVLTWDPSCHTIAGDYFRLFTQMAEPLSNVTTCESSTVPA